MKYSPIRERPDERFRQAKSFFSRSSETQHDTPKEQLLNKQTANGVWVNGTKNIDNKAVDSINHNQNIIKTKNQPFKNKPIVILSQLRIPELIEHSTNDVSRVKAAGQDAAAWRDAAVGRKGGRDANELNGSSTQSASTESENCTHITLNMKSQKASTSSAKDYPNSSLTQSASKQSRGSSKQPIGYTERSAKDKEKSAKERPVSARKSIERWEQLSRGSKTLVSKAQTQAEFTELKRRSVDGRGRSRPLQVVPSCKPCSQSVSSYCSEDETVTPSKLGLRKPKLTSPKPLLKPSESKDRKLAVKKSRSYSLDRNQGNSEYVELWVGKDNIQTRRVEVIKQRLTSEMNSPPNEFRDPPPYSREDNSLANLSLSIQSYVSGRCNDTSDSKLQPAEKPSCSNEDSKDSMCHFNTDNKNFKDNDSVPLIQPSNDVKPAYCEFSEKISGWEDTIPAPISSSLINQVTTDLHNNPPNSAEYTPIGADILVTLDSDSGTQSSLQGNVVDIADDEVFEMHSVPGDQFSSSGVDEDKTLELQVRGLMHSLLDDVESVLAEIMDYDLDPNAQTTTSDSLVDAIINLNEEPASDDPNVAGASDWKALLGACMADRHSLIHGSRSNLNSSNDDLPSPPHEGTNWSEPELELITPPEEVLYLSMAELTSGELNIVPPPPSFNELTEDPLWNATYANPLSLCIPGQGDSKRNQSNYHQEEPSAAKGYTPDGNDCIYSEIDCEPNAPSAPTAEDDESQTRSVASSCQSDQLQSALRRMMNDASSVAYWQSIRTSSSYSDTDSQRSDHLLSPRTERIQGEPLVRTNYQAKLSDTESSQSNSTEVISSEDSSQSISYRKKRVTISTSGEELPRGISERQPKGILKKTAQNPIYDSFALNSDGERVLESEPVKLRRSFSLTHLVQNTRLQVSSEWYVPPASSSTGENTTQSDYINSPPLNNRPKKKKAHSLDFVAESAYGTLSEFESGSESLNSRQKTRSLSRGAKLLTDSIKRSGSLTRLSGRLTLPARITNMFSRHKRRNRSDSSDSTDVTLEGLYAEWLAGPAQFMDRFIDQ